MLRQAYIESAAQQDAYRTEPAFKLQGSYRNMTKLAARINASLHDDELDALLRDHYRGEAQTLTTGAEENLLKLAHLLGSQTEAEAVRWQSIREEFVRRRKLGGDDTDSGTRIAATLLDIARAVDSLNARAGLEDSLRDGLDGLAQALRTIQPRVEVGAPDIASIADVLKDMQTTYDKVLLPLVTATYRKMRLDHSVWEEMKRISGLMERMEKQLPAGEISGASGSTPG